MYLLGDSGWYTEPIGLAFVLDVQGAFVTLVVSKCFSEESVSLGRMIHEVGILQG